MSGRDPQSHRSGSGPPPRAAYIHVPFCRHRCGYCNFTVIAGRDDLIGDYLRALEIELSWLGQPCPVDTLFFGGGTPTHLPPPALARLLELADHWFPRRPQAEVSIEGNPEDITPQKVQQLQQAGVNRVSLGVQSFRSTKLETLERGHDADTVARCLECLRPAMKSLSIDLMFAAPTETLDQWQQELQQALAFPVDHLSTYGLTFESGTRFHSRRERKELLAAPEDLELAMYEYAIDTLTEAGWEHYEVSNFARPGHRCRHNETYWLCEPFYGVGPGASRFVSGRRESNYRSTTRYLDRVLAGQSPTEESELLSAEDAARERLVFGLRRRVGVDLEAFFETTGYEVMELASDSLSMLQEQELLELDGRRLKLTRKGLLVSDSIWPYLL